MGRSGRRPALDRASFWQGAPLTLTTTMTVNLEQSPLWCTSNRPCRPRRPGRLRRRPRLLRRRPRRPRSRRRRPLRPRRPRSRRHTTLTSRVVRAAATALPGSGVVGSVAKRPHFWVSLTPVQTANRMAGFRESATLGRAAAVTQNTMDSGSMVINYMCTAQPGFGAYAGPNRRRPRRPRSRPRRRHRHPRHPCRPAISRSPEATT